MQYNAMQGEEGPQGPPGEPGQKGDIVSISILCYFSLSVIYPSTHPFIHLQPIL